LKVETLHTNWSELIFLYILRKCLSIIFCTYLLDFYFGKLFQRLWRNC